MSPLQLGIGPQALYLHIPWCHSKCAYCDFYSTPANQDFGPYIDALLAEWSLISPFQPYTLYIGGGTPSILPFDQLQRLILGLNIDMMTLQEATIEANPEDVTPRWLEAIKTLGFNRVSMGVQSLRDPLLQAIGRHHSVADARHAVQLLLQSGLEYSIDLIYGLPGQSLDVWAQDLSEALSWQPPHISCYLLSYEPGTRLYARLITGKVEEASEQLATEMYHALCDIARQHGYHHYEISNFAIPGHEAVHNSRYWDGTPYIGLGASAHSYDGERRWSNPLSIKKYIENISRGVLPREIEEETLVNRINDAIITRLRTSTGLSLRDFARDFGPVACNKLIKQAQPLLALGALERQRSPGGAGLGRPSSGDYQQQGGNPGNPETLVIPEERWLVADAILRELIFED
ncbi:MAG: radical SAM family heme chaperone HemW [Bacteroidales bacterium]|nr:radical SAM family heme chaperone HemW [Bacteroidales bacterium]